jgi:hypothetical protein
MRSHPIRLFVIALAFGTGLAQPAAAADPVTPSLALVPSDVAFYSTSLRLGEQWDKFARSKAFAKLRDLPAVKAALKQAHDEIDKPGNPFHDIMRVLHDPANHDLMHVIHDAFRQEVFIYGGANWVGFVQVAMEINGSTNLAPALAGLRGEDPQRAQLRNLVEVLQDAGDKLQVPETVIGFRIAKSEPVMVQIKRLEEILNKATADGPFKGRVKRERVAGVEALTVSLDGSMIPWDEIPNRDEDLDKLFAMLKKLTLKACLLVKGDYLLVAFGPTSAVVESFGGGGPALATRAELAPLAKHAAQPVIAIDYTSAALAAAAATNAEDITGLADMAKEGLESTPLSKDLREAIVKDVRQLTKEVAAALPKPAAKFSCSFSTARGQETFAYEYGDAPAAAPQKLKLAEHVGGSPLFAFVSVAGDHLPDYKAMVRWLKVFYGHADAAIQETLGEDSHKQFRAGMDMVRPLLERLDSIVSTQLLPAVGEGERALVIDGKWSSKNWFLGADQGGESLPMIELGAVRTLKNAEQFQKSLGELRQWANDVLAKARENGAPLPDFNIPPAESKKLSDGTAYFWPLPDHGQEKQILPNLGVSSQIVCKSLSLAHTERLLKSIPLNVAGVRTPDRPSQWMLAVDFAGMVGVARPWVEKLALPRMLAEVPADAPPGLTAKEIPDQVRTVLDVMQCLRSIRSISYRDGNANVTHSEVLFEDLK